ncbi:9080_t:CDS:2, partial [Racocetra persica]
HLWKVFGRNICIPCAGLKVCSAFTVRNNEFVKSTTSQRSKFQLQEILLEEVWLAAIRFLNKTVDIAKVSMDSTKEDQANQINLPTYFGIRTALRIKKVNLRKLEKKTQYTDLIINESQELGEALGTV